MKESKNLGIKDAKSNRIVGAVSGHSELVMRIFSWLVYRRCLSG